AAALLSRFDLAEWIRYKLDRRLDHILIDEAQHTNAAQWPSIDAMTGHFFGGEGPAADKQQTVIGDGGSEQASFRFQGTSPENFEAARRRYAKVMAELAANRPGRDGLKNHGLGRSYRTAQPVLDFVDAAIDAIGPQAYGLSEQPGRHEGDRS